MKRTAVVALAITGFTIGTIGHAEAAATPIPLRCVTGSAKTDAVMTNPGLRAHVVSTRYRLPNGQTIAVTRDTDPMTAAYAAARAVEVQVCLR